MLKTIAIKTFYICVAVLLGIITLSTNADHHGAETTDDANLKKYWPQWRGPFATGVAIDANPPTTWSETENIKWKVPIPGMGHATPIIWEDRIFVQTAIQGKMPETPPQENPEVENPPEESRRGRRRGRRNNTPQPNYTFELLAYDRSNGDVIWQKTLRETVPHEGMHNTASFASNSPITDGEHIFAYFGSRGLYCLDMDGNLIWEKDIGLMRKSGTFGEGSCPIIYGNTIVILQDHEGQSFIVALDKKSGDELWRIDRDERTTWTTPIVVEEAGKPQVIVAATNRSRGYDIENGDVIWECGGMTRNVVPTPVADNGFVYLISGFRGAALQAINLAHAKGDISYSDEAIAWQYQADTPYVPSPLLHGDVIYFLSGNRGILSAIDTNTGSVNYGPIRLPNMQMVYSSIVAAGDNVYIASRDGNVVVVKHGADFEIIAENKLDDSFNASPAIVGSELYLRGSQNLYCIAE
ncbi:hypothetical protein C6497_05515 [Candidatus Poribacteria bacterium]|nr:MAG: hypothetical protein C6497_05515 [Candidatus Poribacteria bacterium]